VSESCLLVGLLESMRKEAVQFYMRVNGMWYQSRHFDVVGGPLMPSIMHIKHKRTVCSEIDQTHLC
jgi:hypothetical protein